MWRDTVPLTDEQRLIQDELRNLLTEFDRGYWRRHDRDHTYPHEFANLLADHGWLGILIPEEYGGAGMGTPEVMVMMEEIASSHAGFGGAQAIHGAIYTSTPILKYASQSLRETLLPELASGQKTVQSMALTEPNAGSESTNIETEARRDGDEYVINGQKIWISRVDVTDYLLIIARTTPRKDVEKKTRGISMFLADVDTALMNGSLEMAPIPKMSANLSKSFELWFDDLRVPASHLIGEEDKGFYQLLDGLNEERLTVAAEAVGVAQAALECAVEYARDRVVFDRPIGQNQAIQHPLAAAYSEVQAAKQVTFTAATMAEQLEREELGIMANMSMYLSSEVAFEAADTAVQTLGGFGVAREYDVERFFRDARLTRIAPVSQQLTLNYLAETALGLPRSY